MKKTMTRRIILTLCAICFCLVTQAQSTFRMMDESIQQDLIHGFTNGNSQSIVKRIGDTARITMLCRSIDARGCNFPDSRETYSKTQAEQFIKAFFAQYPSDGFGITLIYLSESENGYGTWWSLGEYVSGRSFRITVRVGLIDGEYRLTDLIIQ